MKKMKQNVATSHQPYSSYNTGSSMASGYPVTRPSTKASASTFGHLPAIPQQNPFQQNNGIRLRPASGLQLSVKPLQSSTGFQPTIPRERPPPQIHRLSSSDSKALEQLRGGGAPSPNHAVHPRRNSSGEHLLRTRTKQQAQLNVQKESATLSLSSHPPPPSAATVPPRQLFVEVLPPIGTATHDRRLASPTRERAVQLSEEETDTDTSSDLEDEVWINITCR